MKIRRGEMGDFRELYKVMNSAPELKHVKDGLNYNKEWVRNMIRDRKKYVCLVAEEDGKIEGFLTAEFWKIEKYSFILDVFVSPRCRRMGIGSALMNEHQKLCKKAGIKFILISVLVNNKKMKKFLAHRKYEKGTEVYYYERKI